LDSVSFSRICGCLLSTFMGIIPSGNRYAKEMNALRQRQNWRGAALAFCLFEKKQRVWCHSIRSIVRFSSPAFHKKYKQPTAIASHKAIQKNSGNQVSLDKFAPSPRSRPSNKYNGLRMASSIMKTAINWIKNFTLNHNDLYSGVTYISNKTSKMMMVDILRAHSNNVSASMVTIMATISFACNTVNKQPP